MKRLEDGSFLATGKRPKMDTYLARLNDKAQNITGLMIEAILALEGLELTDETAKAFFMGFSCAAGLANVPTNIGTGEEITSEDIASVLAVARFQLVIGCSLSALMTDRLDG